MQRIYDTYNFQETIRLDEQTEPGGRYCAIGG